VANQEADDAGEAERAWVHQALEAMVREAAHQADLTAAFLKARGVKPKRARHRPDCAGFQALPPEPVAALLLELAAALRLDEWERRGIKHDIAPQLPAGGDAIAGVVEHWGGRETGAEDGALASAVFRAAILRLAPHARPLLGADVPMPAADAVDVDALVDRLAAFLWQHRHLSPAPPEAGRRGETDASE
jgi:hypothetical protein